jgi:hypothetical protein
VARPCQTRRQDGGEDIPVNEATFQLTDQPAEVDMGALGRKGAYHQRKGLGKQRRGTVEQVRLANSSSHEAAAHIRFHPCCRRNPRPSRRITLRRI